MCITFYSECPCGRFGNGCLERCSRHCIDNEPCDHISGECPSGCEDGYIGMDCTKSKISFYTSFFLIQPVLENCNSNELYVTSICVDLCLWNSILAHKIWKFFCIRKLSQNPFTTFCYLFTLKTFLSDQWSFFVCQLNLYNVLLGLSLLGLIIMMLYVW